ncbi:MAG: flavodoxin family protein [Thermodesulfovibrionales bacterium]
MIKVTIIDGSPREDGNTETLLRQIGKEADGKADGVYYFKLSKVNINFCRGCFHCRPTGECIQKDEMDTLINAIQQSSIVVVGSPVYMGHVSGQMKVFMDRLCRLLTPDFKSRLNGTKRALFVYTHGNPDPDIWLDYFQYLERMFGFLGFQPSGRVVAAGTRDRKDIMRQQDTISRAKQLIEGHLK